MVKKQKINFEIPAYVLGILAIVQAIFSPLIGLVLAIIGLIMSYRQDTVLSRKAKILNWIGFGIGIIFLILLVVLSFKSPELGNLWS